MVVVTVVWDRDRWPDKMICQPTYGQDSETEGGDSGEGYGKSHF